jgi:hypothetical protein
MFNFLNIPYLFWGEGRVLVIKPILPLSYIPSMNYTECNHYEAQKTHHKKGAQGVDPEFNRYPSWIAIKPYDIF